MAAETCHMEQNTVVSDMTCQKSIMKKQNFVYIYKQFSFLGAKFNFYFYFFFRSPHFKNPDHAM